MNDILKVNKLEKINVELKLLILLYHPGMVWGEVLLSGFLLVVKCPWLHQGWVISMYCNTAFLGFPNGAFSLNIKMCQLSLSEGSGWITSVRPSPLISLDPFSLCSCFSGSYTLLNFIANSWTAWKNIFIMEIWWNGIYLNKISIQPLFLAGVTVLSGGQGCWRAPRQHAHGLWPCHLLIGLQGKFVWAP